MNCYFRDESMPSDEADAPFKTLYGFQLETVLERDSVEVLLPRVLIFAYELVYGIELQDEKPHPVLH